MLKAPGEGVRTKDEVVLCQLSTANLLLHGVAANVNVDIVLVISEDLLQFLHVIVHRGHDGDDQDLTWTKPVRPFAAKMLDQDSQEPLETANDGAMNDDRACPTGARFIRLRLSFSFLLAFIHLRLLIRHILELEIEGALVVQLERGALEFSLEGIGNRNVDLWPVKSTVAFVNGPVISLEIRHGLLQLLLRVVPCCELAQILFRTGGKLQFEGKPK